MLTLLGFILSVGLSWLSGLFIGLTVRPRNVIGTRIIFVRDRREQNAAWRNN